MRIWIQIHDAINGRPAADVVVRLERFDGSQWREVASARTDDSGRIRRWTGDEEARASYRVLIEVAAYYAGLGMDSGAPVLALQIRAADDTQLHHVPVVLSPFSSTVSLTTSSIPMGTIPTERSTRR